ncbi:hypothetical protein [Aquiflexum balticum]|uniref:hypothetical protein n=1 Tax=Aquiflexum balticum TaxID=280473 RepID=UPI0012F8EF9F|nr:hypothetical protein [Aquiflexum balticum]
MIDTLLTKINTHPKIIFLVDGLGALLTTLLLLGILIPLQEFFGMPKNILIILSLIALAFAVYSFCCYFFLERNWKPFLFGISIANFFYCCLTLSLVYCCFAELTGLGVTYFLLELMVVMGLVMMEWKLIKAENMLS